MNMRNFVTSLLCAVLLTACGDGARVDTWGAASEDVSKVYCDSYWACYYNSNISEDRLDECVRHSTYHMCGVGETCDDAISDELRGSVDECVADIPDQDCGLLTWGILPASCEVVFNH